MPDAMPAGRAGEAMPRARHSVHEGTVDGWTFARRPGSGRSFDFGDRRRAASWARRDGRSPRSPRARPWTSCRSRQEAPGHRALRIHVARRPARRVPAGLHRDRRHPRVAGPDLSEAAIRRAIELSATKYCPVNAMVSAGATEVHHRYASARRHRARRGEGEVTGDRAVPPARRRSGLRAATSAVAGSAPGGEA